MEGGLFEWDESKNIANQAKHGVSFEEAREVFADPKRIIYGDPIHSQREVRHFCFGDVGGEILTVRFTMRGKKIRIIGAGCWRKGKGIYEKENRKV